MLKIGVRIALIFKLKSLKYKIVQNEWQRSRHGTVGAVDACKATKEMLEGNYPLKKERKEINYKDLGKNQ